MELTHRQITTARATHYSRLRKQHDPEYRAWLRVKGAHYRAKAHNATVLPDQRIPVPDLPPVPPISDAVAQAVYTGPPLTDEQVIAILQENAAARDAKRQQSAERKAIQKKLHFQRHRLRKFGLTSAQVADIMAEQNGTCAICGRVPRRWHYDHDHATGKFRGLLCSDCNPGLGYFGDSPERLETAAAYLRKHSPQE